MTFFANSPQHNRLSEAAADLPLPAGRQKLPGHGLRVGTQSIRERAARSGREGKRRPGSHNLRVRESRGTSHRLEDASHVPLSVPGGTRSGTAALACGSGSGGAGRIRDGRSLCSHLSPGEGESFGQVHHGALGGAEPVRSSEGIQRRRQNCAAVIVE